VCCDGVYVYAVRLPMNGGGALLFFYVLPFCF